MREQLISGLIDDGMIDEILNGVNTLEDIGGTMSNCVLIWACRLEAHWVQKMAQNNIKETKESDAAR